MSLMIWDVDISDCIDTKRWWMSTSRKQIDLNEGTDVPKRALGIRDVTSHDVYDTGVRSKETTPRT